MMSRGRDSRQIQRKNTTGQSSKQVLTPKSNGSQEPPSFQMNKN